MIKLIIFLLLVIFRSLWLTWIAIIDTVGDFEYSITKEKYNNFKSSIKEYWK